MIESPHGKDAKSGARCRSTRSTARTREPTRGRCSPDIDVLGDRFSRTSAPRIYTYIYTMANCLRAAQKATAVRVVVWRTRPNPNQRQPTVEGAPRSIPRSPSFVGPVPDPRVAGTV